VLYEEDYEDARLAPIYDVITTTCYIKKDIPALRMSDAKLWWKEKTYKTFAKLSCGLSNKEYEDIVRQCENAIAITKKEIEVFAHTHGEVKDFLEHLSECWKDKFDR